MIGHVAGPSALLCHLQSPLTHVTRTFPARLVHSEKYAEPNSYHISSTLADTLAALDAECYEPTWYAILQ